MSAVHLRTCRAAFLDRTATLWTKGGTEAAGGAPYSIAVNSAKKRTSVRIVWQQGGQQGVPVIGRSGSGLWACPQRLPNSGPGLIRLSRSPLPPLLVFLFSEEPGWFTDIETGPLARLDAWPATPAATAKEGGGGRGAEEAAGALFRARTAADAIRSALAQTRQALQSPDMKSAVVNTDLEAPYAEYERGLAGLLEKRRAAEAALTAIVSEYVNDPGQANLPPPPTIPQATAPPRLASDSALWPKKPQLLTRRERDDLLQATGDFFSELLTEAEAAEVRALEEQVRESQTLMAKAHEMAASTRRGFHTALEAVLSRLWRPSSPGHATKPPTMNSGACFPPRPKPLSRLPSRPPWPGDQVLQRSLQLGLFLGLLDDGLQSGEAPFPVCEGLLAPRDPLGVQRGQSQPQLLHAIHGILGHALDFQEPC